MNVVLQGLFLPQKNWSWKIRNLFYKNVFSARKNPHEVIVNPFTEQLNKGGKKVTKKFTPPINSVLELDDKKKRGNHKIITFILN